MRRKKITFSSTKLTSVLEKQHSTPMVPKSAIAHGSKTVDKQCAILTRKSLRLILTSKGVCKFRRKTFCCDVSTNFSVHDNF